MNNQIKMTPTPAFERRVKRHVIGPQQRFFAAVSPGIAPYLLKETTAAGFLAASPKAIDDGVLFNGRLRQAYHANLQLRLPTRIWMRISEFSATNFRRLHHKIAKIPWELHLYSDTLPQVQTHSAGSRLYHTAAVSERIAAEIQSRTAARGYSCGKSSSQKILARIRNDQITLSLDTSGDALYKRGLKTHRVSAPLRETYAALALILLGYDGSTPLLDPMTGAGSFSLEGAMIKENIPPGWYRNFQFMAWPAFRNGPWMDLKRKSEKEVRQSDEPTIFASDIEPDVCNALNSCIARNHLDRTVTVRPLDFFQMNPETLTTRKGCLVLNPPYGRRLGSKSRTTAFYKEVAKKLAADFQGWRLALILPDRRILAGFPFPLRTLKLHHGGLKVCLAYGAIS